MTLRAKLSAVGLTKDRTYNAVKMDDGYFIKDKMVKVVLDDGSVALRAFSAFEVVEK